MIRASQIPDEVVAVYVDAYYGKDLTRKAAFAAALNAWPGIRMMVDIDTGDDSALKLPLPQEVSDE